MATATLKAPHKHELKAGEVCGSCSLRAPPTKRCRMCNREIPDWPKDEIGFLEAAGWTVGPDTMWLEPRERVLRDPTPEMIADAMNVVHMYEVQLAGKGKEYWRNDKLIPKELEAGLEKARRRLANLRAGEKVEVRPQQRLSQQAAVQAEYGLSHPYNPKTIDEDVPTYTEAQISLWESQARARHNGLLTQHESAIIDERRDRRTTTHRAMCCECRRY